MIILVDSWRFVNSKKSFISFSLQDHERRIYARHFVTPCSYNVCEKAVCNWFCDFHSISDENQFYFQLIF